MNLTWLKFGEAAKHLWHQGMGVLKSIRSRSQNHDCKWQTLQLLLVWQTFILGEKNLKLARSGNEKQKFSIFDAGPTRTRNGQNLVTG